MQHDYYRVLGVDPNADISVIAEAYRQRAMECHPDRGGSHEQMVLVNEAWEILSNPELRRRYNEARAKPANLRVQTAAAADAQQARQQAEEYPRRWADFEAWLDGVAQDFRRAEFKRAGGHSIFSNFPTAGRSVSGWLFILVGAFLGLVFLTLVLLFFGVSPKFFRYNPSNFLQNWNKTILFTTSTIMGGWVGAKVHQMIANAIKQSSKQASHHTPEQPDSRQSNTQHSEAGHPNESKIIVCGNCGQKLRVPIRNSRLLVKCKKCQHEFHH
jgi:curved DNA-binding protein CbpA